MNIRWPGIKTVAYKLFVCVSLSVLAVFIMAPSGSEGLTLSDDWKMPVHLESDGAITIDTEWCESPTLTGGGWVFTKLWTDSSGDIKLWAAIPPGSPEADSFEFCGDPLDDFSEGYYELDLDSYTEISGGNKLRLVFDVPNTDDDLVLVLQKGTPKFKYIWDEEAVRGISMPFIGNNFDWTVD